jgi:hypothetical protein
MSDLVVKLRDAGDHATFEPSLYHEAADEIKRLREYIVQQHNYFTGNLVADVVVTTGTKYEDVQPKPFSRYSIRSGPR